MIKRIMRGIGVVLLMCTVQGCTMEPNYNNNSDDSDVITEEQKKSAFEEEEAFKNRPIFSISVESVAEKLEKDEGLKTDKKAKYCILKPENETFEILVGEWGSSTTETIYFTIHDEAPMKNDNIKNEILGSIKSVLELLGEEYREQFIVNSIEGITKPEQVETENYSEKVEMFFGNMGDDFDFRISPR